MKFQLCALVALIAVGGACSQSVGNTTLPDSAAPGAGVIPKQCIPTPCMRMYRPVCASVNGVAMTVPTMCDYNNKVRCTKEMLRPGETLPEILMLHPGACTADDPSVLNDPNVITEPRRNRRNRRQRRRKQSTV